MASFLDCGRQKPGSGTAASAGLSALAARQACRDRGLNLSLADALIARRPPAGPLPAALSATFRCQA